MREILDGLLIGDSYLRYRAGNPNFRSLPAFGHNCGQRTFTRWVAATLSVFGLSFGRIHKKPNGYGTGFTYQTQSRVSDILVPYLHRWYPSGIKTLPPDLRLTPTVANLWYCGDGGFDSDKGYLRQICIAAHCFSQPARTSLSDQLNTLGFKSRATKSGTICISKNSIPAFLEWIGPAPTKCYRYKWNNLSYTSKQTQYR